MKPKIHILWPILLLAILPARAQQSLQEQAFSLQTALEYAYNHANAMRNAQLEISSAEARVKEIRGMGLPQIKADANLIDNLKLQTSFLPAVFFDPNAEAGAPPVAVQFGVQYMASAQLQATQLLFDGNFFLGLKAAQTFKELASKQAELTKVQIADQVSKAYYLVLVSEQNLRLLEQNYKQLDRLFQETRQLYASGMVELIEVDRLQVQLTNLQVQLDRARQGQELALKTLKFQMGYDLRAPISLSDSLHTVLLDPIGELQPASAQQRVEYALLDTQRRMAELDLKNVQYGYLPKLYAFGSYGANAGGNDFSSMRRWFGLSSVGLTLSWSIFDGSSRHFLAQQKRLRTQQLANDLQELERQVALQQDNAQINYKAAYEAMRAQQQNVEVAKRVYEMSQAKLKEGVGSSLELTTAETAYTQATTNYLSATYEVLIAKLDWLKANGKLVQP